MEPPEFMVLDYAGGTFSSDEQGILGHRESQRWRCLASSLVGLLLFHRLRLMLGNYQDGSKVRK